MQQTISVGISFPREIIRLIDKERKDVPRSRYLLRILERQYAQKVKKQRLFDSMLTNQTSSKSKKVI